MTIEKRIEALEKRCKRLGKTLVGVGTLALFAVVVGTAGWTVAVTGHITPEHIVTKTSYLKDHNGKVRLSLFGSNGSIFLKDSTGRKRLELYGGNGSFHAKDKAGRTRISLNGDTGSIGVYDKAGKRRVYLNGKIGKIAFTVPNKSTITHP